jgi:chorismate mutase
MKQQELNTLLDFIQKQNSPDGDKLVSIVLKMASDSAALKAVKNKPAETAQAKKSI